MATPSLAPAQPRTRVPFVDLAVAHLPLRGILDRALAAVVSEACFTNGPDVAAFEEEFAAFCGVPWCVGVSSGHAALELILRGLGVGPGDEVVLPAQTFAATAEAVIAAGAQPVLADISASDRSLDPGAAAAALGPRTRAILPVHLHGQMS